MSVLTASSTSGQWCLRELLSRGCEPSSLRGCFRTQAKAQATLESLGVAGMDTVVGADALQPETLQVSLSASSSREAVNDAIHQPPFTLAAKLNKTPARQPCFAGADTAVVVHPLDHSRGMDDSGLAISMLEAAFASPTVKRVVYVGSWTVNHQVGHCW